MRLDNISIKGNIIWESLTFPFNAVMKFEYSFGFVWERGTSYPLFEQRSETVNVHFANI